MSPRELSERIVQAARALGFSRVGIAPALPLDEGRSRLEAFLAAGYDGAMAYLSEGPRHDPRALLPEAKSVIVVALSYGNTPAPASPSPTLAGRLARYAQGDDYHLVLKDKLAQLERALPELVGRSVSARACVDTAPLLERELAARAGVGFHGKSTLVIAPGLGSYVLLGELLVDVELEPTQTTTLPQSCGSCRACLDACPTQAFVAPHELDARRCVSYLTIEQTGPIPVELRRGVGDRVFGCDVCQEVCPYNHGASAREAPNLLAPRPERAALDLVGLLELGSAGHRKLSRRTALRRVNRVTLQRNAAVALGNSGSPEAIAPLVRALGGNPSALVRRHAAWALGELAPELDTSAREALLRAAESDADADVRNEARAALSGVPIAPT